MIAIKATARKLAVMFYNLMTKGFDYVEQGVKKYEEQYKIQITKFLQQESSGIWICYGSYHWLSRVVHWEPTVQLSKLLNLPRNIPHSETAKVKTCAFDKPDTSRNNQVLDAWQPPMLLRADARAPDKNLKI